MQDFAPQGPVETDLTQAVADGRWRIKRAAQIENAIVAITLGEPDRMKCNHEEAAVAFAQAQAWLDRGKDLNLLTLYERRLQREQSAAALPIAPPRPPKRLEPKLVFSTRPKHRRTGAFAGAFACPQIQ